MKLEKHIRIIPRLDIKGPNVIKGIHLECLRVVGNPQEMAAKYYNQGADEIIYIDTVASLYGRDNLLDIVSRASENVFIPMTAGGGIRSLSDIKKILRAGADKVSINTYAVKDPGFIKRAAKSFGSQCIVGHIEAKRVGKDKWEAYTDNGREQTGLDVVEWAKKLETLGIGELLITSIDNEGTAKGYDLELINNIATRVSVPVIASGGAGKPEDILKVITEGRADAVTASHIFHYNKHTIGEIKKFLTRKGIEIRNV